MSGDLHDVAEQNMRSRPKMQQGNPVVWQRTTLLPKDVAAMESGTNDRAWVVDGGKEGNRTATWPEMSQKYGEEE
jgi:hypothetical protein